MRKDSIIMMRKIMRIASRSHKDAPIGLKAQLFDEIHAVILEYVLKRHNKRGEEEKKNDRT